MVSPALVVAELESILLLSGVLRLDPTTLGQSALDHEPERFDMNFLSTLAKKVDCLAAEP